MHVGDALRIVPAHNEGCRNAHSATGTSGRTDRPRVEEESLARS